MKPLCNYGERLLYGLVAVLGLSFWFLVAFPFANHNESYIWVAQLSRLSLLEVLSKGLQPVSGFRPLGLATAWAGFKLSGGSIYPQQVFNYLIAALAWLILLSAIREKKMFAWVSLIAGGAFFSGYIYLFHLHGVFYSPLLAFVAFLVASAIPRHELKTRGLAIISVLAAAISLYHPFALPLYGAYLLGHLVESGRAIGRKRLVASSLLIVAACLLMRLLVPGRAFSLTHSPVLGLLTSYRTMELKRVLSAVSLLLSLGTVLSMRRTWRTQAVLGGAVVLLSLIFLRLRLPILIVWVAVSFLKAALASRWRIALVIAAAAILPAVSGTGSPTYAVFAVMCCCCILALDSGFLEKRSAILNAVSGLAVIGAVLAVVALRAGVSVPVVSKLATPVLAEKEKTFQLDEIIRWWAGSDHHSYRLVLGQAARNPTESTDAIDRTRRAPTSQDYLDAYVSASGPHRQETWPGELVICFGEEKIDGATKVYAAPGRYNGEAAVYLKGP